MLRRLAISCPYGQRILSLLAHLDAQDRQVLSGCYTAPDSMSQERNAIGHPVAGDTFLKIAGLRQPVANSPHTPNAPPGARGVVPPGADPVHHSTSLLNPDKAPGASRCNR